MNTFVLGLGLLLLPIPPDVHPDDILLFPPEVVVQTYLNQVIIPHKDWVTAQYDNTPSEYSGAKTYWRIRRDDMVWRWDTWDDLRIAQNYYYHNACVYNRFRELCSYQSWPEPLPGFLQAYHWRQFIYASRDNAFYMKNFLRNLRNKIGYQAYYLGHLPDPVPVWLFEER